MKTSEFDYQLDPTLIAQHPTDRREDCRLMVMDRSTGALDHGHFYDLPKFLKPGDTLVLNDTRVIPARLFGHRPGKEEKVEVLLLRNREGSVWECLVKPGKKVKEGQVLEFGEDQELTGKVLDIIEEGQRLIEFHYEGIWEEVLDRLGNMPLPPYITEKLKNKEDYQTVYARVNGSAAAPTAGLHFTRELLDDLAAMGVHIAYLTLHVGLGTFRPVKEEEVEDHAMHSEYYVLPKETAERIRQTKAEGHRVIAVGTTVTRTLESVMKKKGEMVEDSGWTDIFIYPGFQYEAIDGIITNFHLPKSSLIMMIAAFTGKDKIMNAYKTANDMRYRFFSFGDAMLIANFKQDGEDHD